MAESTVLKMQQVRDIQGPAHTLAKHIFISYAHEDSRFVLKLARHLRQQGLAVWLDQWHISLEQDWPRGLERAVKQCSHFLIVLSPAAVESWLVRDQFVVAARTGKTIVPIVHQPCVLPEVLQHLSHVDFTGHNFEANLRRFLSQYFPGCQIQWGNRLKLPRASFSWTWLHYLLPLLWPGWLGPLILFLLLVVSSLAFLPRDSGYFALPVPVIETLAVVRPTATPQPLPTPINIRVRVNDGQVMVFVPAGEFLMGSVDDDLLADEDEKPQRPVYLNDYWIDKTEITNVQYQLCVDAGVCTPNQRLGKRFAGNHQPVIGVNWSQSMAYCQWAGGRLPTEAEWEKAARGTDGRIYPWGNDFDGSRLNFCDRNCIADWKDRRVNDAYAYTAPVGSFPSGASPYGVLDMSGNVWEWAADWYASDYYGQASYENPAGPATGQQRVIRGGSWYYYGKNLRITNRHRDVPDYRYDNIGFRCVMDG